MAKQSRPSANAVMPSSENRILNSLNATVAVLDRHGTIVYVNEAWRRFSASNGGSLESAGVGTNYLQVCRSSTGVDVLLAEEASRGIEDVLQGIRSHFQLEYPCHSPTEQRWFLLDVSRLEGHLDTAITTHIPITERKLSEQRRLSAERLSAIGQAMRGLSHEGRKSLQRAQAAIDLLQLHMEADRDAIELLARIERAQEHLLRNYDQVRQYAAPVSLSRVVYPLDQLVRKAWNRWDGHESGQPELRVTSRGNVVGYVDVASMRSVFRHAFENALVAAQPSPMVEVCCYEDQLDGTSAVTAVVRDNGPGIPQTDWESVFEPFRTTRPNGTGLGLAFCRRIVDAHCGRIYFGDADRRGASLYITLPSSRLPRD